MSRPVVRRAHRRLLLLLVLFGSGSTLGCDSSQPRMKAPDTPGFDATAELNAWVELWATYDLARVDDLFLDDPRLSYFSSEKEGLMVGPAAIRAHHEGFEFVVGGRVPEQELWVDDVHVSEFGNVAVIGATWHFGDRARPGEASRGPMTVVYVDEGQGPKIAHMHFADY